MTVPLPVRLSPADAAFPLAVSDAEIAQLNALIEHVEQLADMFAVDQHGQRPPHHHPHGARYRLLASSLATADGVICFGDVSRGVTGFDKGPPRECYSNAGRLALAHPDRFVYFEGIAMSLVPMDHAWLWDRQAGCVFDPTWITAQHVSRDVLPDRRIYMGVPIANSALRNITQTTGYWGVLDKPQAYKLPRAQLLSGMGPALVNAQLHGTARTLDDIKPTPEPVPTMSSHRHFRSALARSLGRAAELAHPAKADTPA